VWSARPDSLYVYDAKDMPVVCRWPLGEIGATFTAGIFVGLFTKDILQLGMT
jgi:hypothetical protein